MAKKLISYDDEATGLGLPDAVEEVLNSTYGTKAEVAALAEQVENAGGDTLVVVVHGDDPYHPRPDTSRRVMWLGSVVPFYRTAGDLVPEVSATPAPWSPEMLDLLAWYDPATGYESGPVAQIVDRGPRNLSLDVGGSGGISINTTVLSQPAFDNGGTAFATSPVLPVGAWEHPVTVYMVASLATLPSVSTLFDVGGGTAEDRVGFWVNSGGRVALTQGSSVQSDPYLVIQDRTFLLAVTFTGGTSTQAELDGSVVVGPVDAGSNTPRNLRLFANPSGSNISSANIGDVIIASGVTPEQHADTVAWLQEKWGLV